MRAIIVWHYYEDGKLVDYSITDFTGDEGQLHHCLKSDVYGKPKNEGKEETARRVILHGVIPLSW